MITLDSAIFKMTKIWHLVETTLKKEFENITTKSSISNNKMISTDIFAVSTSIRYFNFFKYDLYLYLKKGINYRSMWFKFKDNTNKIRYPIN